VLYQHIFEATKANQTKFDLQFVLETSTSLKNFVINMQRTRLHFQIIISKHRKIYSKAHQVHTDEATHGLDGQHQDVDRTPRGKVSQNDRGQG